MKLTAPLGHLLNRMLTKLFLSKEKDLNGARKSNHPKSFLALPVKDLLIRYRSILSGYLNYYSFVTNRPRLRVVYTTLKRSLIGVLMQKFQVGIREVFERYGPNLTLNIRKKDGTTVSLDFKCPALRSTPEKFLGTFDFKGDPLTTVN